MFLGFLGRRIKWGPLGRHIKTIAPDFERQDESEEDMAPWPDDKKDESTLSLRYYCGVPKALRKKRENKTTA